MASSGAILKTIEVYVKQFCYKCVQIIVQSRSGEALKTICSSKSSPVTWFNLSVGENNKAQKLASSILHEKVINYEQSFVVEILLQKEDEFIVLEAWSIEMSPYHGAFTKNQSTYYSSLTQVLKSLLCISRATPAHKLSRNQGQDYKINYRIYRSKLDLKNLGSGAKRVLVGSVDTPLATLKLSVHYRSKENIHMSARNLLDLNADLALSSSFLTSSARPCYTTTSRVRTLSQTSDFESRFTDTPPSVYLGYSPTSERKIDGSQRSRKISGDGSVSFVLGSPPKLSTSKQSPSNSPSNAAGFSSTLNKHSPNNYYGSSQALSKGSPCSFACIDEESWQHQSPPTLEDSKKRKEVVRVTSGFFDPTRQPSPAGSRRGGGGGADPVMGAFVRGTAPADDALRMLSECRASRDSYRDWAERVTDPRRSLESSSSSEPFETTGVLMVKAEERPRKEEKNRSERPVSIHHNIIKKRDVAFAYDDEQSACDKLTFYQCTKELLSESCFRQPSPERCQEKHEHLKEQLAEFQEDASDFDEFARKLSDVV